jgi:ribosomal protein S18 acetylase RimI-like enzyme
MRKLKIMEHISLDGVIQASGEDGFPYADRTVPYRTPAGRDTLLAEHGGRFDLLLGRRTYDMWSAFWPAAPSSPMAEGLNAATKYVATHRPESLEWPWPDSVGSSTLTSTLLEQGLADEVLLVVYPVLLGTGKRLFAEGTSPCTFEHVSAAVGWLWLGEAPSEHKRSAFIYDILVRPEYRGQGHGTRVLQAVEAWANTLGMQHIDLHVFGHNTGAQRLYNRAGYRATNIRMRRTLPGTP